MTSSALILVAIIFLLGTAQVVRAGEDINVHQGWVAATEDDRARVFIEIDNEGSETVVLTRAESPRAKTVMIEAAPIKAGSNQPVAIPELPISSGKTLAMDPDGIYLILDALNGPLVEGTLFEVVLTFSGYPPVAAEVLVEGPNAEEESHAGHNH
ncbi:MAG: copper chaperone PCu(A)C [Pseudomonadota bacterium]